MFGIAYIFARIAAIFADIAFVFAFIFYVFGIVFNIFAAVAAVFSAIAWLNRNRPLRPAVAELMRGLAAPPEPEENCRGAGSRGQ